ncbi:hypothetical protein, partial [Burkholderia ambifaria]|uniref:hypothetical protein n=1 Tax=Burkholderia ambifaria TaxID=152480 RepID=UPI001ABAC8CC
FRRRPSTLRNGQNEETEVAKPTLKPDIFKWLEGGHLNPGMTWVVVARLKCPSSCPERRIYLRRPSTSEEK